MDLIAKLEGIFPRWAAKRRQVESLKRYYDAGYSSQYFKRHPGGNTSADSVVSTAGMHLRAISRYLDENSDLSHGILDTLEKKVIGTGLELRPRIKSTTGKMQERLNRNISRLWYEYCQNPEVTRELSMDEMQRVVFRTFCRDGEMLAQHVRGVPTPGQVAYSVELLEADYLPFNSYPDTRVTRNMVNSVEKNEWGQPIAFWVYKSHPGGVTDGLVPTTQTDLGTKRVDARDIIHYKYTTRFRQTRGVPILTPALRRMESIKDYEESELVAARVNAALTAFVTKSTDFAQAPTNEAGQRVLEMMPGMIYDNLLPGESVATVSADRPNPELVNFRNAMLKAAAVGTRTSYSDISKDYSGTYSSQRQEMVSQKIDYDLLRRQFINDFLNPVYREFIQVAQLSGVLRVPQSVELSTLMSPEWSAPAQPWIDPKKEADAWIAMHEAGLMSKSEIVDARGTDLNRLYTDLKMEQEIEEQLGLAMEPEPATTASGSQDEPADTSDEEAA
jgi:lambda family phage portal protein